jgi:hypothetical protein
MTAMNDDDGVRAAARTIRPYLAELIGADGTRVLDEQLAALLNDTTDPAGSAARLRELLEEADDTTSWFLHAVLADAPRYEPPYQLARSRRERGMASPAGDPTNPVLAPRYSCPRGGDYVWYRPDIGTPIPECPTHGVELVRG